MKAARAHRRQDAGQRAARREREACNHPLLPTVPSDSTVGTKKVPLRYHLSERDVGKFNSATVECQVRISKVLGITNFDSVTLVPVVV